LALYTCGALTSCVVVTSVSSSLMQYRFIARQFNSQKNWWIKNYCRVGFKSAIVCNNFSDRDCWL